MTDYTYGEVIATERLTPSMVRVRLGGGTLQSFATTGQTDEYINCYFVPEGAPYAPPFALDEVRDLGDMRPRPRRFTVRDWNPATAELTVDFVAHGDVGFAGSWAQRAVPGDRLQFKGPGGGYAPNPDADVHVFVGDESALPAIARSLESLPTGAKAVVLGIVDDAEHELPLESPADLQVIWLHRGHAGVDSSDAVATALWGLGLDSSANVDLFVHGEAAEVRAARKALAEIGVDISGASISPYWRRDHTDEQWRSVKRDWLAEQANDLATSGSR